MEDGIGSDEVAKRQSLEVAVDFIERSGVDVFAPSIGNAHGVYVAEPTLDAQRVSDLVEATGIPIALHGGTGMTDEQFSRPDRPRLREGEHLDGAQSHVHEGQPRVPARRRGGRQVGSAVVVHGRAGRGRGAGRRITSTRSAARARPGEPVSRALIFDCDGVLADTERFGHLPAFNQMFAEFGAPRAMERRRIR